MIPPKMLSPRACGPGARELLLAERLQQGDNPAEQYHPPGPTDDVPAVEDPMPRSSPAVALFVPTKTPPTGESAILQRKL